MYSLLYVIFKYIEAKKEISVFWYIPYTCVDYYTVPHNMYSSKNKNDKSVIYWTSMGKYLISKFPTYILKIRFRHRRKGKVRDDPQIMMCEHSHNMKKTENKESRNYGKCENFILWKQYL